MDDQQFYNPKFTAFILALVVATVLIVKYPSQMKNLTEKVLSLAKNVKSGLTVSNQTPTNTVAADLSQVSSQTAISFGAPTPDHPALDNSFVVSSASLKDSVKELAQPITQPLISIFQN